MPSEAGPPLSLANKRALLIAPRFFGYENDIAEELRRRGAHVDFIRDRPFETPVMKAVTRFRRNWVMPAANRFYRKELAALGASGYDLVLVVNGQTLSTEILKEMRAAFPRAAFVLYMWDSARVRSHAIDNLPMFDRALSFDPESARKFGMTLRPLFFVPGFNQPEEPLDLDVSFVGTVHTDRYPIISSIARQLPADRSAFWYLYLQSPWVYRLQKTFNPAFKASSINEFAFAALPRDQVQIIFRRSRAIIDIEHPLQTGLTMRTLETFGAGKKLLTTNHRIVDYDLFNPANIHVLDRHAPTLPLAFLEAPYQPPPTNLLYKYSLAGWADDVLTP
jgi:hypothetical protein